MIHKTLVALDLDRTLTKESTTVAALERACADFKIDVAKMKSFQKNVESKGGSFFPLEYLADKLSLSQMGQLKLKFKEYAKDRALLYDDVLPFLKSLSARAVPIVIVTYGGNDWQKLKIEASELHYYSYIVTDQKVKGALIKRWFKRGAYTPDIYDNHLSAKTVILIDDKASSFNSLPSDCYGYLIRRPEDPILPSQIGEIPPNVKISTNLMEIFKTISTQKLIP